MVGLTESPQDAEQALTLAFTELNTRQRPEYLAEMVIHILAEKGYELRLVEIDAS